jgi:hypothetical protein
MTFFRNAITNLYYVILRSRRSRHLEGRISLIQRLYVDSTSGMNDKLLILATPCRLGVSTMALVRSRLIVLAVAAVLPAACAAPELPVNPFVGAWTTAEQQQIAFRDDTVVVNAKDAAATPMAAESCAGAFRFGYGRKSRDALLGLTPQQPDLRKKLAALLVQPEYPVAELACGAGGSTYVLVGDRELVAIYRDRDVAGVERLSRL